MTHLSPDERQALREKHADQYGMCVFCSVPDPDLLGHTMAALYPCDAIKVLDATENLKPNNLKTEVECTSHKEAQIAYLDFWNTLQDLASLGYRRNASCAECGKPLAGWSDLPTVESVR